MRFKETTEKYEDNTAHSTSFSTFLDYQPFDNTSTPSISSSDTISYNDQALAVVGSKLGEFNLALEVAHNAHTLSHEIHISSKVQKELASQGYVVPIEYFGHLAFHNHGSTTIDGISSNTVVKEYIIFSDSEKGFKTTTFREFDSSQSNLTKSPDDPLNPKSIGSYDKISDTLSITRISKPNETVKESTLLLTTNH